MLRTLAALALAAVTLAADSAVAQRPGVMSEETLSAGGRERRFLVHDYSGGKPAPAVFLLHGGGGNPENAVNMTQFDAIAAREGLIAVYPGGTGQLPRVSTWNATHCCAYAMRNKVDDVAFIGAVIDRLVAAGKADPKRIYVTGMSNGGMMSHRLGRELSGKVAAIAPVVGALFGDEPPPAGPVAAMIIVGAVDRTVPGEGGPLGVRAEVLGAGPPAEDRPVAPAGAQGDYWAKANGCGAARTTQDMAAVRTEWAGCKGGADVVFLVVADNGHAWPGGRPGREGANPPSQAFNASETMWAFFKAHPKK